MQFFEQNASPFLKLYPRSIALIISSFLGIVEDETYLPPQLSAQTEQTISHHTKIILCHYSARPRTILPHQSLPHVQNYMGRLYADEHVSKPVTTPH